MKGPLPLPPTSIPAARGTCASGDQQLPVRDARTTPSAQLQAQNEAENRPAEIGVEPESNPNAAQPVSSPIKPYGSWFDAPKGCDAARQRRRMINRCAYPKIQKDSDELKAEETRFFTISQLRVFFHKNPALDCICDKCYRARDDLPYLNDTSLRQELSDRGETKYLRVAAVLLYLNQFHLIYRYHAQKLKVSDDILSRELGKHDAQRFRNAFDAVREWLKPLSFKGTTRHEFNTQWNLGPNHRLPFIELGERQRTQFGKDPAENVRLALIHPDHVDESIHDSLKKGYEECLTTYNDDQYFCLAIKEMPALSDSAMFDTEQQVINFLKVCKEPDVEDSIVLFIGSYRSDHLTGKTPATVSLIFPFVKSDLERVLEGKGPAIPGIKGPDHGIWQSFLRLPKALHHLHSNLGDGVSEPLAAFHCDVKPDNILVSENGNLRMTDFGESVLLPATDFGGDAPKVEYKTGARIYQPPEVYPSKSAFRDLALSEIRSSKSASSHLSSASSAREILQSYDVWQLACIMILILTYMFEGHEGVARFHAERERGKIPSFFEPVGNSKLKLVGPPDFKLRDFVLDKFDDFKSKCKDGDVRLVVFLRHCRSLLKCMFEIAPEKRMPSKVVVEKLSEIMDRYNERPMKQQKVEFRTLLATDLDRSTSYDAQNDLHEVGWEEEDGKFVPMCDRISPVIVENLDGGQDSPSKDIDDGLRALRVFYHLPHKDYGVLDDITRIDIRAYRIKCTTGILSLHPTYHRFDCSTSFFFQCLEDRSVILAAFGDHPSKLRFTFASLRHLHYFQEAILLRKPVRRKDAMSLPYYSDPCHELDINFDNYLESSQQQKSKDNPAGSDEEKMRRVAKAEASAYTLKVKSAVFVASRPGLLKPRPASLEVRGAEAQLWAGIHARRRVDSKHIVLEDAAYDACCLVLYNDADTKSSDGPIVVPYNLLMFTPGKGSKIDMENDNKNGKNKQPRYIRRNNDKMVRFVKSKPGVSSTGAIFSLESKQFKSCKNDKEFALGTLELSTSNAAYDYFWDIGWRLRKN